jgi:hypothetical protein
MGVRNHFALRCLDRIDDGNSSLLLTRNRESGPMTGSRGDICEGVIAKSVTVIFERSWGDHETADRRSGV